jgi:hypothetical protein
MVMLPRPLARSLQGGRTGRRARGLLPHAMPVMFRLAVVLRWSRRWRQVVLALRGIPVVIRGRHLHMPGSACSAIQRSYKAS